MTEAADRASPATSGGRIRTLGAAVALGLAAASMAGLWVVAASVGPTDVPILDLVAGPDGILSFAGGAPLIWLAPLVGAGLSGALLAVRAAGRRAWTGLLMGYLTYALGIALGTVIVVAMLLGDASGAAASPVAVAPGDLLSVIPGAIFLAIIAAIVLAPMLAVCAVAGVAWAAIVRRAVVTEPDGTADPTAGSTALAAVLAIGSFALAALWAAAMWFLDVLEATSPVG